MAKVQLIYDGKVMQEYELNKPATSIGRHPSNDIVIDNRGVSGKHAVILFSDGKYVLKDLESTNGTKLNNKKVSLVELKNGDQINLFKHMLNFVLVSANKAAAPESTVASHSSESIDPDATIMLDAKHVNKVVSNYKNDNKASQETENNNEFLNQPVLEVTSADEVKTIALSNKPIIIGKKKNCHIQTGGWVFTPAISAVIKKDLSGVYSINPETAIRINGKKINEKQILKNGDRILVKNTLIVVIL